MGCDVQHQMREGLLLTASNISLHSLINYPSHTPANTPSVPDKAHGWPQGMHSGQFTACLLSAHAILAPTIPATHSQTSCSSTRLQHTP